MKRELMIQKVFPALVFLVLWLDGRLYPIVVLPFLYVILVEKKTLSWMGFRVHGIWHSTALGLLVSAILVTVFAQVAFLYAPVMPTFAITPSIILSDVLWYPIYEEVTYRSFFLAHSADFNISVKSKRNVGANICQAVFFTLIHRNHMESGMFLLLVIVFLLGLLNGMLFVRTKNITGCFIAHASLNTGALLLRLLT
ncbi:MAG: type II CAAX prenyl endopeptidase Rce1 family protein [Candidatus Thorarchaeota archaeon]